MRILLFNINKNRNICISNVDSNVKDQDLIDLFQPYGEVVSAHIQIDVFTGASRGFGFVEMTNEDML